MPYAAYNPKDYVPDYSWISNIGAVAAGVVAAIPKARELSRQLKENDDSKNQVYAGMDKWLDDVFVNSTGQLDEEQKGMRDGILANMGIDKATMEDPVKLKAVLSGAFLAKPTKNETPTEYMTRLMPKVKSALSAIGNDSDKISWLNRAGITLQSTTGMNLPEEVTKKMADLSEANKYTSVRKQLGVEIPGIESSVLDAPLLKDENGKDIPSGPNEGSNNLSTIWAKKAKLIESREGIIKNIPSANIRHVDGKLFDEALAANAAKNEEGRVAVFKEWAMNNTNTGLVDRLTVESPDKIRMRAEWQAMGGKPETLEKILGDEQFIEQLAYRDLDNAFRLKLESGKNSEAAKKQEESKNNVRTRANIESIKQQVLLASNKARDLTDRLGQLKDAKGSDAAASRSGIESEIKANELSMYALSSILAGLSGQPDPTATAAAAAFKRFMPRLIAEEMDTKKSQKLVEEMNEYPLFDGLFITVGGAGDGEITDPNKRGLVVADMSDPQNPVYIYGYNNMLKVKPAQWSQYEAKIMANINAWANRKGKKLTQNFLSSPAAKAVDVDVSSSASSSEPVGTTQYPNATGGFSIGSSYTN
jgi:hypothetical protein